MSNYPYVPESKTEIYYPKSRRRKVIDHHGNVISDTKDKRMTLVFSEEHRRKMSLAKLGAKHPLWKGDQVGYGSLHEWVKNHKPRPELCEDCDESPVKDLANITGVYNRDFSNWKYLCHKCHMIRDNTIDMSDRRCSECNSPNTYFKSNGRPDWRYSQDGRLLCFKCNARLKWIPKTKRRGMRK